MNSSAGLPWAWGDLSGTHPAPAPPGYDGPAAARGVRVDAPAPTVWLWLRQLQVAPYSYDLLDNWGHRSPRVLTPGLTEFTPGQRVLTIFTVMSVSPGERVVLEMAKPGALRLFGALTITYNVTPLPDGGTGLRGDLHLARSSSRLSALHQTALLWGDVPMMRKQLLTLKECAERDARR
ncbi:hypothetical protein [Nocardioides sp. InS609-2]|uniref:hypothetical protein n=1 Tax=Nocardioides sp. InS609-2 TaxID=2760705 RepID=UPI0020BE06B3|nr:hypothetical protein [Nocardioides sp. InS609-2]